MDGTGLHNNAGLYDDQVGFDGRSRGQNRPDKLAPEDRPED
jgi:hypothetical protein